MKIKSLILFVLSVLTVTNVFTQNKYYTRDGHVSFFSSTPVEDIKAVNRNASCIFDQATGKVEFNVPMKSFKFEKALMQEHFNEDFIESNEYPDATFKGVFEGIENVDFKKEGEYTVTAAGDFTVHGVTREREDEFTFIITEDGEIRGKSVFMVKPADHDIEIPGSVRENIAKEVEVTVKMNYKELKR